MKRFWLLLMMLLLLAMPAAAENGEVYVHDPARNVIVIPGAGEAPTPAGSEIVDAYHRGQRLFVTLDTADDRHFLMIVTWMDGFDVRTVEMPWQGAFDDFHIPPEDDASDHNDYFILYLDAMEDFGYLIAREWEGRWILEGINTGWEVIDFAPWGVRQDVYGYWAYGTHEWHDLETMDWTTLPLTFEDAVDALTHEGWLFPKADTAMYASPDKSAEVIVVCEKDTPLRVIRTEGDWAYVGQLILDDRVEQISEPPVGYIPLTELSDMPEGYLPGGELLGWFCQMQVEDGVLTFAPLDGWQDVMPLTVAEGFAEAACEIYRETGYAATPAGFDARLLPYLEAAYLLHIFDVGEARAAVILEDALLLAVEDPWTGEWTLRIVTEEQEQIFGMPGPFGFDRHELSDWDIDIIFVD